MTNTQTMSISCNATVKKFKNRWKPHSSNHGSLIRSYDYLIQWPALGKIASGTPSFPSNCPQPNLTSTFSNPRRSESYIGLQFCTKAFITSAWKEALNIGQSFRIVLEIYTGKNRQYHHYSGSMLLTPFW